jgi:RHS repeat-associated protein
MPFSTVEVHDYDTINLATLGIQLNVPVRTKSGHIPFSFGLTGGVQMVRWVTIRPNGGQEVFFGVSPTLSGQEMHIGKTSVSPTLTSGCSQGGWVYTDAGGTAHPVPIGYLKPSSCGSPSSGGAYTSDGSGVYVYVNLAGGSYAIDANGNTTAIPRPITSGNFADANGNAISFTETSNGSNSTYTYSDTLTPNSFIRTTPTTLGTNPAETDTWTDALGNNQSVMLYTTPLTLDSDLGFCGWNDSGATSYNFPSSVTFPDNSTLSYGWEQNYSNNTIYTGRLALITLPTGGMISYTYTGGTHGINCVDGSPATMTRTTPDGRWTYVHTPPGTYGSGLAYTQVTDPQGNNIAYTFEFFGSGSLSYSPPPVQIQKLVYNGSVAPGNLIQTVITCYNNPNSTPTNCNSSYTLPVTEKDEYTTYKGVTGYSAVKTIYDTYGRVTDVKTFDFNAASPTNEKVVNYGSGSPTSQTCTAISTYIIGKPCSVTLLDSQHSNATLSQTWNAYDGNGNVSQTWNLVSGSGATGTYLSKQYTYDSHGVVQSATDVNGQVMNYSTSACTNMFVASQHPTNFSNLTPSQTWDCNGGVVTSATDVNGQTTQTKFYVNTQTDPFYRPLQDIDQLGNTTSFTYTPTSFDSTFLFNGNASVIETLSSTDSIGRPVVSQLRQGPGNANWDTKSRAFDSDGRVYQTSLTCVKPAGTPCPASTESQTYDALNRPLVHTGTGGDIATKQYIANDVLTTLTPAPSGENSKATQKEFDGLGRLRSVCVISGAPGSGSCLQANGKTGFLTQYVYDAAGRLLKTVENAQVSSPQQSRSYTYDLLGRVLTETNPESGTTYYTYDSVNGSSCTSASAGDMVQKQDANGNISCYHYDGLHRDTYTTYAGPNSNGISKYLVYDAATVNGVAMTYAEGRMAEAYTCAGSAAPPCTPTITDEGFSYDQRGQLSAYYQKSPHSNGYYSLIATRWEDGGLKTVSGVGLPTLTYGGLDGEGRVTTVSAGSGTNPVSGVTYNNGGYTTGPIGALLNVTLGTGDQQNFTYDLNTGRMKSYSASVGATPTVISGSLNWNPNGTLQQNNIVDGYNPADTQVCNYLYDDFVRVAGTTSTPGVNCVNGSTNVWNQTFTYGTDSFGNLTKSTTGPGLAWACTACYNTATNQYNSLLSGSIAYDLNGNLTNDTFHVYTWLADGHVASIATGSATVSVTYDAMGNKVEENNGGTIHEYVSAFGVNAQMTGSTENATTVALSGGMQALYSGGTLQRFRFPDWEGTIRAESNPATRAFTESLAFAPFGERYAVKGAPYNVDSFTGSPDQMVSDEYDFTAREEHNGQGRWISPDPLRGTGNKYAYADNNPLSKVDLGGLLSVLLDGLVAYSNPDADLTGFELPRSESSPPQSTQTAAQTRLVGVGDDHSEDSQHTWLWRLAHALAIVQTAAEREVRQKAVDTRIQNERRDIDHTCPVGCLGRSPSEIKKMTPQQVDQFWEAMVAAAQYAAMIKATRGWGGRLLTETEQAEFDAFAKRAQSAGLQENPGRTGSWGKFDASGKFQEVARIDVGEPGQPGMRGETHIHVDGQGDHLPITTKIPGEQ